MKIKGTIKEIFDEQVFGSNGFTKREFVVTTEEQYPQHIIIELVQDKCEYLDGHSIGDEVEVSINLRGREWVSPQGETKYFNTIQAWKIEGQKTKPTTQELPKVPPMEVFEPVDDLEEDDKLPF